MNAYLIIIIKNLYRECLAFATEPVFASLDNLLGNHDGLSEAVVKHLKDHNMFDVEIKYGLLQVSLDLWTGLWCFHKIASLFVVLK